MSGKAPMRTTHPSRAGAPAGLQRERNGMPLAMQVCLLVRRRLESGEWRVGEKLPTIADFMAEYGVSRATVRSALAALIRDGLIDSSRGRGTHVMQDATRGRWLILPTDWRGLVDHIDLLHARVVTLAARISSPPALASGEGRAAPSYWCARRVNWTDQAPYSLTTIYIDARVFRQARREFETSAVAPLIARRFPGLIVEASQALTISAADVDTARHLNFDVGAPVAEVRRIARDSGGVVVYLAEIRYPARHLRLETRMAPPALRSRRASRAATGHLASPVTKEEKSCES